MGIDCYQCSSSKSISCTDNMIHDGTLSATSCDHVFEARYCIKTVGVYGGTSFILYIVCTYACLYNSLFAGANHLEIYVYMIHLKEG
jgi:hypothetical protein